VRHETRRPTFLLQLSEWDLTPHPTQYSIFWRQKFYCLQHCQSYLQSCYTRVADIQTTAAAFCLSSSRSFACSSLYSRQAGVSGFWCHRLERPASLRRICAVARGFQTTTRDHYHLQYTTDEHEPRHSYDSCVTITIHHYCLDTCDPCNN